MKRFAFLFIIVFCLICLSSCVLYHDVIPVKPNRSGDIYMVYKDEQSVPLFSSGIMNYLCDNEKDISKVKLSYIFEAHNISLYDNPVVELNSFSFTDKKGNTIPCNFYYIIDDFVPRYYVLDSLYFKIDTLPFNFDINKHQTGKFTILVEAEQLYHKTKEIYVNFDIAVNNERIIKKKNKYKWKLWIQRLI